MPAQIDLIQMISNAGLMVQLVLLLLLFFSITSWSIIIIKYRYICRAYAESTEFVDYFWKSRDLSEAYAKAKQLSGSPVARIFRVGYVELSKLRRSGKHQAGADQSMSNRFAGTGNIKRSLRRAINNEMTRMTQMVPFLATTGNTTPFIGLFGTVWGIMNSFHGIGLRGSASLAVVAPGISEALVATAAGLGAAIPAVIAYNHFSNKIRVIEIDLENFAADLLNIIERDILNAEGRAMITGGGHDRLMSDINVTPFVDVMLVLLIIFMVTAPMMVQGVDVALPETTAEPLPSQEETLMITIDADRQIFINNVSVGHDALQQKLGKIMEGRGDRQVYLRADRHIPYGDVVRVMAEIKSAGVEKLGMVTIPLERPEQKER